MKIIPLPEADSDLLKAAKAACQEAELALGRANKACQVAQDNYDELLKQTRLKHGMELGGQASDDQIYLFGNPLKTELAEAEPVEVVELPPEPEPEAEPEVPPVEEPPLEEPPPPLEEPPLEDPEMGEGVLV